MRSLNAATLLPGFRPPLLVQFAVVKHGGLQLVPCIAYSLNLLPASHLHQVFLVFLLLLLQLTESLFGFALLRLLVLEVKKHLRISLFLLELLD
jgi:hypothetical protein